MSLFDWSTGAVASAVAPLAVDAYSAGNSLLNQLVYSGNPAPPAPAPPPAVVNPSQADLGQSAIDASLSAGAAANQQMYQQFFGNVADTNANANAGLSIVLVVALLAGLFVAGKAIR